MPKKPRTPSKPSKPKKANGLAPNVHDLLARAVQLMDAGQTELAESTCRKVLARSPDEPEALHLLGVLLGERGAADEGIALIERAVILEPGNLSAWNNLGVLLMDTSPDKAEAIFRQLIDSTPDDLEARGNLATLLERAERYAEAEEALRALLDLAPDDPMALRLLGCVLRFQQKYEDEVGVAQRLLAMDPSSEAMRETLGRAYFLWFDSVDTNKPRALKVLEAWLAFDPVDPVALHMFAAVSGATVPSRASAGYVARHFDSFAETFDDVLTGLHYRAPEIVSSLLREEQAEPGQVFDIVDLGCGTGRLGPLVAPFKKTLVGVDLSQGMLDKAIARQVYDRTECADLVPFLTRHPSAFDLAMCLDTLVYFGALDDLLRAAFAALRSRGRLFCTIELSDDASGGGFALHHAGRYAHAPQYVRNALVQAGFTLEHEIPFDVRTELAVPVPGLLLGARRT